MPVEGGHSQMLVTVTHSHRNRFQTKIIFNLTETIETHELLCSLLHVSSYLTTQVTSKPEVFKYFVLDMIFFNT
jgi:hypothetical protein